MPGFGVCLGSKAAQTYPKILFSPALGRGSGGGDKGISDLKKALEIGKSLLLGKLEK